MRELRGASVSGRLLAASVLLAALAGAGVLVVADGPGDAIPDVESDGATATTSGGTDGTANGTTAATAGESTGETSTALPGYALDIRSIETCGRTCRDVTAALTNEGSSARRNVTATIEVYADGDLLWSGNESVGTLSAGESHASTKRVEVGYAGGMKIRANDGYVTIVTVVRSDGGTTRFSERRNVE